MSLLSSVPYPCLAMLHQARMCYASPKGARQSSRPIGAPSSLHHAVAWKRQRQPRFGPGNSSIDPYLWPHDSSNSGISWAVNDPERAIQHWLIKAVDRTHPRRGHGLAPSFAVANPDFRKDPSPARGGRGVRSRNTVGTEHLPAIILLVRGAKCTASCGRRPQTRPTKWACPHSRCRASLGCQGPGVWETRMIHVHPVYSL